MVAPKIYTPCLNKLMLLLDNKEYSDSAVVSFSQERLAQITDQDFVWHFNCKAYGSASPDHDALPSLCRSSTLKFHKKAILYCMPQKRMVWDEMQSGEGNPTKSEHVNEMIKKVEKHEVQGMGVESQARHPIEWEEFIMLLNAAQIVFANRERTMLTILAVITIQWHFIARSNDIMQLTTRTLLPNLHYPFTLQLKMVHLKNT